MMRKLINYPFLSLIILLLLTTIYASMIKNQRNKIQHQLTFAEQQIDDLINDNRSLNGSIDLLEKQAQQNRHYINDLEQKRAETQQQATELTQQFKRLKNENKTIHNWADQPLPDSLY